MADFVLGRAIDRAFGVLGESSKNALLYQLRREYHIDIYKDNVSIETLESALQDMLGEGGTVLMSFVNNELRK